MKKIVVAIDGFSSCGKSTIAKQLAKEFGYIYVDTGAMYRAVSLFCLQKGWLTASGKVDEEALKQQISNIDIAFKTNAEGVQETYLNGKNVEKEIRTLEVANGASIISTIGFVRKELVRQQQLMGQQKGIVMDGRDIGTVVFPTAELKIFVTAQPEVRAHRRHKELEEKGISESFDAVLANVKERDERDQTRKESPLRQASDALLLDNSNLNKEQQMEIVRQWFLERTQI
ncbi:MAG TPA: (d)CMP kinase [Paludibacteraceae bacterium]|jgi:cytidylate kinase|nr:(d)CMP kinase [Bacteroidales bacterium]HOA47094.1 (d)CMP kinase [Paludibacteraceae bacterium]HOH70465.1 (d)CMP kinase [Paludibacteraceae bacterium]HPW95425.1 (d)CMP kinase [Paludibacteraceae bacterium]HQC04338.1 (d)CMP kinase [Paludibacteraceae bacterium]